MAELKFMLLQTWNFFQIFWIAYVYNRDYSTEDKGEVSRTIDRQIKVILKSG